MRVRSASFMGFLVVEINERGKARAIVQEWCGPDVYKSIAKLGATRTKNMRYAAGIVKVDLIRVSLVFIRVGGVL